MRISLFLLFLAVMTAAFSASSSSDDIDIINEPSTSTASAVSLDGASRLRLRAHRRRHKHRSNAVDELFEMFSEDSRREKTKRKKNLSVARRERNEPLCATERRARDLNTLTEEFDPPFIVEVRCKNSARYERGDTLRLEEQTCVHGLLRCVQRYAEIHVSRRPRGSTHWLASIVRDVPVGCECMWPVDKYGHQEL